MNSEVIIPQAIDLSKLWPNKTPRQRFVDYQWSQNIDVRTPEEVERDEAERQAYVKRRIAELKAAGDWPFSS